jgi:hypothetical protein
MPASYSEEEIFREKICFTEENLAQSTQSARRSGEELNKEREHGISNKEQGVKKVEL